MVGDLKKVIFFDDSQCGYPGHPLRFICRESHFELWSIQGTSLAMTLGFSSCSWSTLRGRLWCFKLFSLFGDPSMWTSGHPRSVGCGVLLFKPSQERQNHSGQDYGLESGLTPRSVWPHGAARRQMLWWCAVALQSPVREVQHLLRSFEESLGRLTCSIDRPSCPEPPAVWQGKPPMSSASAVVELVRAPSTGQAVLSRLQGWQGKPSMSSASAGVSFE